MSYTEEQWQECQEEIKRLRRELKATDHPTREQHERYNAALQKLKAIKDERAWEKSIGREYASIG